MSNVSMNDAVTNLIKNIHNADTECEKSVKFCTRKYISVMMFAKL